MQKEFKEKERVFHIQYGTGTVFDTTDGHQYPIWVKFDSGRNISFTKDGRETDEDAAPLLSHEVYALTPIQKPSPNRSELIQLAGQLLCSLIESDKSFLVNGEYSKKALEASAVKMAKNLLNEIDKQS